MTSPPPEETDILCENCGYMLNGLPPSSRCPECGDEIDLSVSQRLRKPPLWEDIGDPRPIWLRFLITTAQLIFHPTHFYRTSTSRGDLALPRKFARIHWVIASILFGAAASAHWDWVNAYRSPDTSMMLVMLITLPLAAFLAIAGTINLAARLTAWEAAYRGVRLPHGVVLRALYYHSAHLQPVALIALLTCGSYNLLQRSGHLQMTSATAYLYILCAEVILSAGYLFTTYWIGMRNSMYANR